MDPMGYGKKILVPGSRLVTISIYTRHEPPSVMRRDAAKASGDPTLFRATLKFNGAK
jgi:hypothetical protein